MDYRDLAIEIQHREDGGYQAKILSSPRGLAPAEASFRPPCEPADVMARLVAMDSQIEIAARNPKDENSRAKLARDQLRLGQDLYAALFAGKVARIFDQSLVQVRQQAGAHGNAGLRLRLVFDPHQDDLTPIAALPWELLYDEETRDFLGRLRSTPIVRYLSVNRALEPFVVDGPLRVLVVEAQPTNLPPLDCADERQRIKKALDAHPDIDVDYQQADVRRVRRRLLDEPFHVLHFMGHGGFDEESGEGYLGFVAPDGTVDKVMGDMFAETLKDVPPLRLVVLTCCYGATMPRRLGQDPFSSVAPALLTAGVPAVVSMQFRITDAAAIAFSETFYSSLAHGDPVDAAISEARLAISGLKGPSSLEWATPALYMRAEDGCILTSSSGSREANNTGVNGGHSPATPFTPQGPVLRLGIRSFGKDWGKGMENETERLLDLGQHFDDRTIRDPRLWQEAVFPEVREFLLQAASERRPLHLNFAAHASIAFAAGYCLEAKSGLDIRICQRGQDGSGVWWSHDGSAPEGLLWHFRDDLPPRRSRIRKVLRRIASIASLQGSGDVALAISVTRTVLDDVGLYVPRSCPAVGRIMPVDLAPEPSSTGVLNGTHALRLAQQLANRIQSRTIQERHGVLHVFASAPNAFLFFLGQLARGFGRVMLYEYPFGSGKVGVYYPSIQLPPPDESQ